MLFPLWKELELKGQETASPEAKEVGKQKAKTVDQFLEEGGRGGRSGGSQANVDFAQR